MDLVSGRIAYLAGSVVVIQEDGSRRQSHIINETKKAFTSVAFSKDGKTLLTGERLNNRGSHVLDSLKYRFRFKNSAITLYHPGEHGHQPAVRFWDAQEKTQIFEFHGHSYGISCVGISGLLSAHHR